MGRRAGREEEVKRVVRPVVGFVVFFFSLRKVHTRPVSLVQVSVWVKFPSSPLFVCPFQEVSVKNSGSWMVVGSGSFVALQP